jgi:hypothetical protein
MCQLAVQVGWCGVHAAAFLPIFMWLFAKPTAVPDSAEYVLGAGVGVAVIVDVFSVKFVL